MKTITRFLLLMSYVSFAQEYTYIDFGITTNTTAGNWNNFAVANGADASGLSAGLIDSNGVATGATLTIDDAFDTVNTAGTTTPDASLPFPSSASADSFFGETAIFNGTLEPTGGFTITGLDPSKYYSFSIFASRNGVGDNRETRFTLVGSTTLMTDLNTSNNTANTADISNLQPNGSGEIKLTAQPGPNNNNSSGFYYMGAIEMIKSDSPLSEYGFNLKNVLSLYPNPVDDFLEIKMNLKENSKLKLELYDVNGRMITNLYDGEGSAGDFQLKWERSEISTMSSGIYFLKINVNNNFETTKLFFR